MVVEVEAETEVEVEAEVGMVVETAVGIVVGIVGAGAAVVGIEVGIVVEIEVGVEVVEVVAGVDGLYYQLGKVGQSVYRWLADQRGARRIFQCDQLKGALWLGRGTLLCLEGYFCWIAGNSGGE